VGEHSSCVDDGATHDWEADLASRLANGLAFWIWYLPADMIRHRRRQRRGAVGDSDGLSRETGAEIAIGAAAGTD
jgi:hypothetical protein